MRDIPTDDSNSNPMSPVDMAFFPGPFEWVQIIKGDAIISHPFYNISEVIRVSLPDFYISKYPITNEQFNYYLQDTGQETKASTIQRTTEFYEGRNPVVDIYYFEAVAFCRWLSHKINRFVTLPSDSQWIRAARGNTAQQYPWGNIWTGNQCNTQESEVGHTTTVDRYPAGASPFGVMDMLGNVYEWCCTDPGTGQSHMHDNPNDLNPFQPFNEVQRVFMGGSFDSPIRGVSLNRYGGATTISQPYVTGIRLVLNLSD